MLDLRELYQDVILDHGRRPRNFGRLQTATHRAKGYNPLCGDKVDVYLEVRGSVIEDVRFEGSGCAISTASASLMTESLRGKSVTEALALFERVHEVVTGQQGSDGSLAERVDIGKLAVFEGVRQYPLRVKCATLAWHAVKNALEGKPEEVARTE